MLAWIRRLRRPRPESTEPTATPGQRAADAALSRAEAARARVRAQREQVQADAGWWRRRREENHLAELVRDIVVREGR
jgi:hypothetical protein